MLQEVAGEGFDQALHVVCCRLPDLINVHIPVVVGDDIAHPPHVAKGDIWKKRPSFMRNAAGGFPDDFQATKNGIPVSLCWRKSSPGSRHRDSA